jgi:hypothetical protein
MIGVLVPVTPGNAEDEYLRRAADRALQELYRRPIADPIDIIEAMRLRERGQLN